MVAIAYEVFLEEKDVASASPSRSFLHLVSVNVCVVDSEFSPGGGGGGRVVSCDEVLRLMEVDHKMTYHTTA